LVVGSHHSVVSARRRCELARHLLQARIDGLVTELTKDNEKTAREKLRTADDKVKGLEAELEAELEAIRLQALEPASQAKTPAGKGPASVRERAEASEIARKEQRQRSLRQLQLDRADAEELLNEQVRLSALERASIEAVKQELEARIAQRVELEARITQRSAMLGALQAQPDWFNYVAAFAGSVVSTLIMHPLDTLKTRAVASSAKGGRAEGGGGDGGDESGDGAAVQRVAVTTMSANAPIASVVAEAAGAARTYGAVVDTAGVKVDLKVGGASSEAVSVPSVVQAAQAVAQQPAEVEVQAAVSGMSEEVAAGVESKPEEEHEGWSVKGYLSLYQGIDGALVKEGPPSALYLGIYEIMKSYLLTTTTLPLLAIYLVSGRLFR